MAVTIGDAKLAEVKQDKPREIVKLTVLEKGSKDSIFNLFFKETENGNTDKKISGNGEL